MLVRSAVLHAPDVVICDMPLPDSDWFAALHAVDRAQRNAHLQALADGNEMLLGLFEQLSEHYERSMQLPVYWLLFLPK
jgi:hypothetical protein